MKHVINQRKMLTSALTQFLTDLLPDLLSRPLLRAIVLAVNSTSSYCNCKPIVYVHIYSTAHLSQLLTMPLIFTALHTVCVQPPYLLLPSCLSVCLSVCHTTRCVETAEHIIRVLRREPIILVVWQMNVMVVSVTKTYCMSVCYKDCMDCC